MPPERLDFERLQRLSGLTAPGAVASWLELQDVRYALDERALPWSTLAAILRARGRGRSVATTYPCADLALELRT